jgi:hypothetical protein
MMVKYPPHLSAAFRILLVLVFLVTGMAVSVQAQTNEPPLREAPEPETYQKKDLSYGVGFHMFINNFGFGMGSQYRRVVGPYSQLTATVDITGVRDVSEQRFQFFNQQIIPNKYRRVIGTPMMLGYKQRFFPHEIVDNFRLYGMAEGGAIMAFVIPYFQDLNGNGLRDDRRTLPRGVPAEPINDIFQGWKNADTQWGYSGSVKIGVDFGTNFEKLSSVEFGYNFYYFPDGIQMMEPRRPKLDNNNEPIMEDGQVVTRPSQFDPMYYFGTPQISLVFGSFW